MNNEPVNILSLYAVIVLSVSPFNFPNCNHVLLVFSKKILYSSILFIGNLPCPNVTI